MYHPNLHKVMIDSKSILKKFNLLSLKRSTLPFFCAFTERSLALSAMLCSRLPCIHKAFTLRSSFVQRSHIVQSNNIIFRLIKIHACSLFVIFSWIPTKHTVRIAPGAHWKNRSSCVLLASLNIRLCMFTVHFALCVRSPFTSAHQVLFSERSPFKWESKAFQGLQM